MEMDPLAAVLPQFALDEALAENEARHEAQEKATPEEETAPPKRATRARAKAP